jgi:hypothetical protein
MDVRAAIDARRESARRNCWSFCIVGRQHFSDKAPVDSDPRRTRNRLVPQDQARNTMAQSRFHKDGDVIRTNKTCVSEQATGIDEKVLEVDCGQFVPCRQRDD